jgi:predicted MFS family arabinose efflux permease
VTLREACQMPFVASALSLTLLIAVAVRGYFDLLPGITGATLGGGPVLLALLSAAAAVGAIVGGVWMVSEQAEQTVESRLVGSSLLAAVSVCALAFADHGVAVAACVVLLGGALVVSATAAQSLIQLRAPIEARGRVVGLYITILRGGPALGALMMGGLADLMSLNGALLAGGATALVGLGLALRHSGAMVSPR